MGLSHPHSWIPGITLGTGQGSRHSLEQAPVGDLDAAILDRGLDGLM